MTLSHDAWARIRSAIELLVMGALLTLLCLLLTGCRAADGTYRIPIVSGAIDGIVSLFKGNAEEAANAPADPTQAQVAMWVAAPLGATATLLMISALVMWLLGNRRRALSSGLMGVGLVVINGLVITLLKSAIAVWTILGITTVTVVILLILDAKDGVMFWRQRNGHCSSPSLAEESPSHGLRDVPAEGS